MIHCKALESVAYHWWMLSQDHSVWLHTARESVRGKTLTFHVHVASLARKQAIVHGQWYVHVAGSQYRTREGVKQ